MIPAPGPHIFGSRHIHRRSSLEVCCYVDKHFRSQCLIDQEVNFRYIEEHSPKISINVMPEYLSTSNYFCGLEITDL